MVPWVLPDQKEHNKKTCTGMLQQLDADLDLLRTIIIHDETWIFQYDPEMKQQLVQWKTPLSLRMKKADVYKRQTEKHAVE